jgi:hypothetical protein
LPQAMKKGSRARYGRDFMGRVVIVGTVMLSEE